MEYLREGSNRSIRVANTWVRMAAVQPAPPSRRSGSAGALAAGPLTAAFDWLWYSSSAASSRLNDCVNMYAFIWSLTSVDSRDATIAVM